jgi:uncharacterized protein
MKLYLDRISETPTALSFEASSEWWEKRVEDCREKGSHDQVLSLVEPLRFELRVHKMGADLFLAGSMRGALEAECSRCLARYRHALRDDFELLLEDAGERVPSDPEGAERLVQDGLCLGDELEKGWYRGSVIVLDSFFGEVVACEMPIQPLCREDCAGLCPICGVDRNENRCDCRIEEVKPKSPFAVLEKLRAGRSGGES